MSSTSPPILIDEVNLTAHVGTTTRRPLGISEEAAEKMKGAVKVTMIALGIAAQATQNVPYLGAISTALTEFVKIQNEVDECKDRWKAVVADARTMKTLIEKFRETCIKSGKGEGILDGPLREAFTELEIIILDCLLVLQNCQIKSKRDRLLLYLRRSVLAKSVNDCSTRMEKALQRFNTTLQVDQVIILEHLQLAVDELREARSPNAPHVDTPPTQFVWRIRAAPLIFYGREREVDHALHLIVHQPPARVAILGSGGIGKTSIALAVLHHPGVEARYSNRHCFVSCEAITTTEGVVRALAEAVNLQIQSAASHESAQHHLLSYLKSVSGIVCLDNLETPWNADTAAIEDFLTEIASIPSLALLITSRVTDTPLIKWSSPPLKPLAPFSNEAATQTWNAICTRVDEYAVRIIEAVDCVPLAVTLLARLARTETAKAVWERWERERTDIIQSRGSRHRLNDLSVSIEVSLRFFENQEAIDALAMISMLDGISGFQLRKFDELLKDRISLRRAVAFLLQSSLVYINDYSGSLEAGDILVLSPIRHHMQKHHPVPDELFLALIDIMMQSRLRWHWDIVLKVGLDRTGPCRERCLQIVISYPQKLRDLELLSRAMEEAQSLDPRIQSRILGASGAAAIVTLAGYSKALAFFSKAIEIDEKLGDRQMLFRDSVEWIAAFKHTIKGREDECRCLEEAQKSIDKAWDLGCNEKVWRAGYGGYSRLAWTQHHINNRRRELKMPIVRRSGMSLDNESRILLLDDERKSSYNKLITMSSPPWELSLIFDAQEPSAQYPNDHRYILGSSLQ